MVAEEIVLHKKTRIVSVVAATIIALACGTNYAYGAWAPQFADKLQLSATESNVVGTAANLGMYAAGIPVGFITDKKSPRLSTLIGAFALLGGYYPIKLAYDGGPGYMNLSMISFCSFMSGVGSCAAFQGALKTATLNWPTHRGTATAFPLAAFGLSAFFFTLVSGVAFPGDTSGMLLMLSLATSLLVVISIPFLIVVDRQSTTYSALPTTERPRRDSNVLHRTKSGGSKHSTRVLPTQEITDDEEQGRASDECSSLLSGPGDVDDDDATCKKSAHSHRPDITGLALLYKPEFWQLWVLMALLTGVGLMTINNIGHDVQALWNYWDKSATPDFVAHRQLWHVSILSICSFFGRLFSGIGSDIIVKRLGHSRFWCAAISATVFALAQLCAIRIADPHFLWAVSGLSGFAYGALFGVLPALVVDAFGPDGFSVNWGFMTLAPVISGNVFNLFYGAAFDAHSVVGRDGMRNCEVGIECYRTAYYVTLVSSLLGVLACFWGIWGEHARKRREVEEYERHRDA
ncbi:MFS general substrate transporter [Dothidotthia symphoricarpi CBS 119687]|uniref:MFS general substrate transporter n=1 Tax=Dothidotthia symphoricarpi CBS 119687 TaxID=1392245 RepID=A0A6A6A9R6_9PLEO|nr:MFS general substrate transporter [Dothidotthia symphoricarpi CBS 119687]KAF2127824.1 MFS general substrate transporter [Dothidotthia symphoricarpi CBS 119687]